MNGGQNGQIGPNEYSSTPRFVLTVSPPLSWTTPANNDPAFNGINAGVTIVSLITQGTALSIEQADQNAQEDIQDAIEKALRTIAPNSMYNNLNIDLTDVVGFKINAFNSPYAVTTIDTVSGTPSGTVELGAVTKQCVRTCAGGGVSTTAPTTTAAPVCGGGHPVRCDLCADMATCVAITGCLFDGTKCNPVCTTADCNVCTSETECTNDGCVWNPAGNGGAGDCQLAFRRRLRQHRQTSHYLSKFYIVDSETDANMTSYNIDTSSLQSQRRAKRQSSTSTICNTPFPSGVLACEDVGQYDPYTQVITVKLSSAPLLPGLQWREVADSIFKTLNSRRNVIFTTDIEVYSS
uniref:Uncharacterized protein n=1 Tax=Acrobeloides nanus TaxID=290746 RepID=A0A914E7H6_9BILA